MSEIEILYRDECLLGCDKPAGLLSVPGRGPEHTDSLITRLQACYPGARTVHRLDCETSGVTVVALDERSHRELSRQFHDRETEKTYIAVCAGSIDEDEGEIDIPISPDRFDRPRQRVDYLFGKDALTRWRVLARGDGSTRLELTPVTGRSHQLRLHLAALGHPILGDSLYAPPEIRARATRLLLHALKLAFQHPRSLERVCFCASRPF